MGIGLEFFDLGISGTAAGVQVTYAAEDILTLTNVLASQLSEDDSNFV